MGAKTQAHECLNPLSALNKGSPVASLSFLVSCLRTLCRFGINQGSPVWLPCTGSATCSVFGSRRVPRGFPFRFSLMLHGLKMSCLAHKCHLFLAGPIHLTLFFKLACCRCVPPQFKRNHYHFFWLCESALSFSLCQCYLACTVPILPPAQSG